MKQKKNRILRISLLLVTIVIIGGMIGLLNITKIQKLFYPVKYENEVTQYATAFELDPALVNSIIYTESKFKPGAESNVGARGLMQITEETFAWIKLKNAPTEEFTFDDMFIVQANIRFGTYFLSRCIERYGDLPTAVAAYHSGWGTVDELLQNEMYSSDAQTLHTFPYTQMNLYVQKVMRAYKMYQKLYE